MTDAQKRLNLARALWRWQPHPTQEEWLLSEAQTKVAACGRRWGKTEAAAVDVATTALQHRNCIQMIVSPTYDQSRLIFDRIEQLMMSFEPIRKLVRVVRTPYPRLTVLGSLITARTADEDGRNLRGHCADRVVVDEAAYVRENVINEVIRPMLADRDGQLIMISTPFGKNHFYRAFVKGKSEERAVDRRRRYASFTFPSWTNPHISAVYVEEQRRELSPRQFAVEYEAQFLDDCNAVFEWEDIERAIVGASMQSTDYDFIVAGVDWARYGDYTAVVAVGVVDGRCEVVGMDRFNGIGWAQQTDRVVEFLRTHRVCAVLTDRTSVGDPLTEQLQSRLWDMAVEGYTFTSSSKRELVEELALRFAHGTISIPRDEQLIKELQYFEYELTDSGNVRLGARSGYHDDLVIALALACKQAKRAGYNNTCLVVGSRVPIDEW
jgi:phage FluMu gp28-like protein